MAMYTVSQAQLMTATVLSALIAAGTTVMYFQFKERQSLPTVYQVDSKCTSVVNFKNGDAYTCEDVDIILRNYKKEEVSNTPSSVSSGKENK
jgi:hypothetical protein